MSEDAHQERECKFGSPCRCTLYSRPPLVHRSDSTQVSRLSNSNPAQPRALRSRCIKSGRFYYSRRTCHVLATLVPNFRKNRILFYKSERAFCDGAADASSTVGTKLKLQRRRWSRNE